MSKNRINVGLDLDVYALLQSYMIEQIAKKGEKISFSDALRLLFQENKDLKDGKQ